MLLCVIKKIDIFMNQICFNIHLYEWINIVLYVIDQYIINIEILFILHVVNGIHSIITRVRIMLLLNTDIYEKHS